MRIGSLLCLVAGAACLVAGAVLGVRAIQQATEIAAYEHARPCPAGAPASAGCLRPVDGSVTAVTEFPGGYRISPDYALDVRTAAGTLHLMFTTGSPMLDDAVDGNPAVVTMWRGVAVSVTTGGLTDVTTAVPRTALARDLGNAEEAVGIAIFLVLGGLAIRANRRAGGMQPVTRPVVAAGLMAALLGGLVLAIAGVAMGGKPTRLGPDLAGTGAALAAVLGLSAWLGVSVQRRAGTAAAALDLVRAGGGNVSSDLHWSAEHAAQHAAQSGWPDRAAAAPRQVGSHSFRKQLRPATRARRIAGGVVKIVPVLLTVGVLFGVLFTCSDGPRARAYRSAPACVGETNLATCAGDFTAVVNGVRAPANGAEFADVSYANADGQINNWGRFDGNPAAIVRAASADESARTPLRVRVWRGSIVGGEFGGRWHWAQGNPPGNTYPTLLLAISFALLLLMVRSGVHRRAAPAAGRQGLIADDLGQAVVAGGGIVLLAIGFWPGAILVLAALAWLGLSVRRITQHQADTITAIHP